MADNDKPKMSTCPICGYTDTADDANALDMAIAEHVRMAHNLDAANLGGTASSVKPVSGDKAAGAGSSNLTDPSIPLIAASPNTGGSGPDGTGIGYGAGQGILAAEALNDDADTTRADITNTNRNDETSRF